MSIEDKIAKECSERVYAYFYSSELGMNLLNVYLSQMTWSQATFGSDEVRGPIGALRHLEIEAKEAQDATGDIVEYADCLLLLLDASRRAGFTPLELINAAADKLKINKERKWPTPTSDEPVEHIKGTA